jgi:putative nucleotidyltransferase with HDIG domain
MKQGNSVDIRKVLDVIQQLPSLPSLVIEILENFNNEKLDAHTLANKIVRDQGIVARVLRVANSPFFGLSGRVGSIFEAVSVLGVNNLRGLVTAAAVIGAFPIQGKDFDWEAFWRHGIATAACAKALAKHSGLSQETAFTAGLLHDVGKLVMGIYFPKALVHAHQFYQGSSIETLQAERATLGLDHAALGGEVAKRWHFPPAIREAVELHHTQAMAGAGITLTDIVYIANLFAHALDNGCIQEEKAAHLTTEAWLRLRLDSATLEVLAGEAQRLYDGAVVLIG